MLMCDGSITNGNNDSKEADCSNNFDEILETCCEDYHLDNNSYYDDTFCLNALDDSYSFTCANGWKMKIEWACDHWKNCSDNSDDDLETCCEDETYPHSFFTEEVCTTSVTCPNSNDLAGYVDEGIM